MCGSSRRTRAGTRHTCFIMTAVPLKCPLVARSTSRLEPMCGLHSPVAITSAISEDPELGLRDFAAPDLPSEFRFRADRTGRYSVRGDELCGLPHTDRARGTLVVEDSESFRAWVRKRTEGIK